MSALCQERKFNCSDQLSNRGQILTTVSDASQQTFVQRQQRLLNFVIADVNAKIPKSFTIAKASIYEER
jgi:hypothetical protein|uniref:hypothetical protein n=1 Tax=Klebsiella pneumoniae TaxID=573 RepID=UPI000A435805|nr:hypothetical protein [Klebsiella pneumoniae]